MEYKKIFDLFVSIIFEDSDYTITFCISYSNGKSEINYLSKAR